MAYPYHSGEGAGSTSSLIPPGHSHDTPTSTTITGSGSRQGHSHGHGHGGSISVSRKASDGDGDVVQAFKKKIEEDESYINFFQERIQLEEQYIAGLNRLYTRTLAVDTLHEDTPRRAVKPTVRRAWAELRDYTQREAQSREAMVAAIKEDVIKDLAKLRDTQTRIRQGLKENLRTSGEMYDEHRRGTLPKLKRTYEARCAAVEEFKRQENAIAMQNKLLNQPVSPLSPPPEHAATTYFPPNLAPPTSTPPLPPMSNPATTQQHHHQSPPEHSSFPFGSERSPTKTNTRLRAGSATGGSGLLGDKDNKTKDVFNDIAQQSKKSFSAFMQKLGGDRDKERERDETGFVMVGNPDSEGGLQRRGTMQGAGMKNASARAMGAVKTKREAEDADKAYRAGVFHLESLRLRRERLQQSAIQNLDSFNDELNVKLRIAMEKYIDTMHGTGFTIAQSTEVSRQAVQSINLDHDMALWRAKMAAIGKQRIDPVPYVNFYVGECKSLIFGVSLTDYDFTRPEGTAHGEPPIIVERCIAAIDERGLGAEGIYRISGRKAGIQQTIQDIERDEAKFNFSDKDDVYSITNVLKQYLRELPDPVFPLPHPERVKHTENRETHIHSNFSALRGKLRRLPLIHQTTFRSLIEHLGRVQSHSSVNKMDAKNLSVVFMVFGHDQLPTDGNVLTIAQERDTVLEDLITFSDLLFAETSDNVAPTLLPPGSGLSRTGVMSYHPVDDGPQPGSSRTRIQIVNPDDSPFKARPETTSPEVKNPEVTQTVIPISQSDESKEGKPIDLGAPEKVFTPNDQLDLLFDPNLIPATMHEGLPEDYHIRPLAADDLLRGHFALLATLTSSPALAPSMYQSLFAYIKSIPGTYYIVVFVSKITDELVASGTLFVERKHIHGGGVAGHIEDIVVAPQTRGSGLGQRLVSGLRELGAMVGCYKVILDCREAKVPFYEKCGFERRAIQMAHYVSGVSASPAFAPTALPPPLPPRQATLNLGLPEVAPISPLPTVEQMERRGNFTATAPEEVQEEHEHEHEHDAIAASETLSMSSGSGVTYHFPTPALRAPAPAPAPPRPIDIDTSTNKATPTAPPAWAEEGLGSSALSGIPILAISPTSASSGSQNPAGTPAGDSRVHTPLPPGAAPAAMDSEPERPAMDKAPEQ